MLNESFPKTVLKKDPDPEYTFMKSALLELAQAARFRGVWVFGELGLPPGSHYLLFDYLSRFLW